MGREFRNQSMVMIRRLMLHLPQLSEAGTELQWDINDLESATQRKTFAII